MNLLDHNRQAWNENVRSGNEWTIPVSDEEIARARSGDYEIVLSPAKAVPQDWLGDLRGRRVLCLASGGGQQGPVLAAAGAQVTVFDNSDQQLQRDAEVSVKHNLGIRTVQGNMQDLSAFADGSFDLIVHPVSNCFIDDVRPVWRECCRVLAPGGRLLSGFVNPVLFMVDWESVERSGKLEIVHPLPYSDLDALTPEQKEKYVREKTPFEFGHTLSDQIGGQLAAGFVITGFYEDRGEAFFDRYMDVYIVTRAEKPA
jgi:SAM-dependent methyltransferase